LHPLGKLGFHAPSLVVPRGRYNEQSVTQAYGTALESIEGILRVSDGLSILRSLTVELMSTPPTEMRYIETVGEASRWEIAVAPVIERESLTSADVWRACNNADGHFLDLAPGTVNYREDLPAPARRGDRWEIQLEDGFRQELATGCGLSYTIFGSDRRYYDWGGWVGINDVAPMWAYRFYLPETPINQIALKDDQVMEFGPQPDIKQEEEFAGSCYVLRSAEIIDLDPCVMSRDVVYFADYSFEATDTYTWPSGARTVVTHSKGEASSLNGYPIPQLWDDPDSERTRDAVMALVLEEQRTTTSIGCYRNSQSGNHFCFAVDQMDSEDEFTRQIYR
jgi:hypothetical protein